MTMPNRIGPRAWMFGSFLLSFLLGMYVPVQRLQMTTTTATATSTAKTDNETALFAKVVRPNITYGLVHMVKTGGTTLNGIMALTYEHVCGNKGNSYDAIQFMKHRLPSRYVVGRKGQDLMAEKAALVAYQDRVFETGFEDCDYVSLEHNYRVWLDQVKPTTDHLQLHVPCRDPIDHLLSMCNFLHVRLIDCDKFQDEQAIKNLVDRCYRWEDRFDKDLMTTPGVDTKCFQYNHFDDYVAYMGQRLQSRRIQQEYHHWETNYPRQKEHECLLTAAESYRDAFRKVLLEHDYFRFCHECMGSSQELKLGANSST